MTAPNPHVHIYPGSREERLTRLVYTLWEVLDDQQRAALRSDIESSGMGWALPQLDRHNDDDWLTPEQAAAELGVKHWTLRKWEERYGLRRVKGCYRWGDIQDIRRQRNIRKLGL